MPEGTIIRLERENVAFACRAFWDSRPGVTPKESLMIRIVLKGEEGKSWEIEYPVKLIT